MSKRTDREMLVKLYARATMLAALGTTAMQLYEGLCLYYVRGMDDPVSCVAEGER